MNKLFNPDNPVMILLSRCCDLILLNACFVVSCIPVFTIGPALAALFKVALEMSDGNSGYTVSVYFASFRENFRQGVSLWLILLSAALFLSFDLRIIFFYLPSGYSFLQYPVWVLLFIVISALIYVFPMMARFRQSNTRLVINALLLGLANIPLTVSVIVFFGIITDLSLHNNSLMILFFSIFLFIGCALLARILSAFFKRIFRSVPGAPEDRQ